MNCRRRTVVNAVNQTELLACWGELEYNSHTLNDYGGPRVLLIIIIVHGPSAPLHSKSVTICGKLQY